MIEDEMMPIPYDIYGEPYIEKQNDIANKYKIIVMIKKQIEERLNELLDSDLIFQKLDINYVYFGSTLQNSKNGTGTGTGKKI